MNILVSLMTPRETRMAAESLRKANRKRNKVRQVELNNRRSGEIAEKGLSVLGCSSCAVPGGKTPL